ncbi:MAG: DEAD/DEAH box helicase, partial [Gammaproteobacteria bacterium]|nr:DEAD/DEAH box helicase [Gammaproteobacteria bacterium]
MNVDQIQRAQALLRSVYGYPEFRPGQLEVIESVLDGRDSLVLMPTGGGKSLCYQIPAMLRPGVGIVISPLIALMQDQVQALRQLGVPAAFLNSSVPFHEQRQIEGALKRGEERLELREEARIDKPKRNASPRPEAYAVSAAD